MAMLMLAVWMCSVQSPWSILDEFIASLLGAVMHCRPVLTSPLLFEYDR